MTTASKANPSTRESPTNGEESKLMQEAVKFVKWKMSILESLNTRLLTNQLEALETELVSIQKKAQTYKEGVRGLTAAADDDCTLVKTRLAELWLEAPPMNAAGKASTQSDKEAWLRQQRTQDTTLKELTVQQAKVLTSLEGFRLETETVRRRIDQTLAVIRLKTAQIEFLGRSI